ncbi:MAG: hypothetical protein IT176_00805 [Acidobacteria bacterium]|nr:hypothetical protein [Acidobacteriota bacterium]
MTPAAIGALLFALPAALSAAASSHTCLRMHVSPTIGLASTKVWVTTRVDVDREHRAIEVIAESDRFYRSSEIELDGARAPRVNVFELRGLPAGVYDVRVVLKGEAGRELAATTATVTLFADAGRRGRSR